MPTSANVDTSASSKDSDDDITPLRCWDCNVNFTNKYYLYRHLFHHIHQPIVVLDRIQLPSLKITLKSTRGNSFEIVNSPQNSSSSPVSNTDSSMTNLAETKEEVSVPEGTDEDKLLDDPTDPLADVTNGVDDDILSSGFASVDDLDSKFEEFGSTVEEFASCSNQGSPAQSDTGSTSNSLEKPSDVALSTNSNSNSESNTSDYGSIPGAEPTPPPEPSQDYPKIRIKTTGLLKEPSRESLTITEITDDNPDGDPTFNQNSNNSSLWTTPSLEDPLKLPDSDESILSLFNNNERAKDLGFHSSESEFISLDRLEDRNRGAMQLYNPSTSQNQNPLETLTGLPMQALAQQVSRLQPTGSGMHQQNVLINIQQFPSGPPQPSYQPPPMYPHYPPQPMHQPYQYQPPNPMYYPPGPPGYPPQHMPPPQPQLPQLGQPPPQQPQQMGQQQLPMQGGQHVPTSQPQGQVPQQGNAQPYRQPMPAPRQPGPRQPQPGARMPNGPRPPMGQRQPVARTRAPLVRPRGAGMTAVRTMRPRMPNTPNGVRTQTSPVKRTPEQIQQMQAKKKKFDLLTPDKDDDDCQVICMQPKNTDGGLPQIASVQGGTSEPAESSIMHLSDSITLSVRNPPPKPEEPKKSDAKAVANILATRGITVTATAKPKEKPESPQKSAPSLPASLNLNGAVSILPAAKSNGNAKSSSSESLPTVDLTDDTGPSSQSANSPQKQRPGLPYRCDLCPAQYPNAIGLNKHRQTYHKTASGMAELGIPLINLKTPGILQKLSGMGINNYIPLPPSGPDGTFAMPIINSRNPGNLSGLGTTNMLSLGPIRTIPKPQSMSPVKNLNQQKS